jgi:WD40 repeat protein
MTDPYAYNVIKVGDERIYKFYRRLLPGQPVDIDQVVAMIDPAKAITTVAKQKTKVDASIYDERSAKYAADEAKSRYEREETLWLKGATAQADLSAAKAAMNKYMEDAKVKTVAIKSAREELIEAKNFYNLHEIQNRIGLGRCEIQTIYKGRGDAIKEQETLMVLNSLEHLLAEALVDGSQLDRIKPEMTATLEPTHEVRPFVFRGAHRAEVSAVGVTNDAENPRIVSAGHDKVVSVRDPFQGTWPINLRHDAPVHALACSPPGASHNYCLVGAGNKIYVWDLDRQATAAGNGLKLVGEPFEAHTGVGAQPPLVTCLAFSPDGAYFASGAEDGSIAIWKSADISNSSSRLVYRFDSDHGVDQGHTDPITTLAFTPQCRLVSAARDNTLRIWKLKEKGAELDGVPIPREGSGVAHLGGRADGKWHLVDDKGALLLVSLEQQETIATMRNPGTATPFETLALVSPDGSLILTAGLADGRLQLWKAPTETARAFEVRQFTTDEKGSATCAAFAPLARYNLPGIGQRSFAVSGSGNGDVYLWLLPTPGEVASHRIENVKVSLLAKNLDPNTHQARIAVEVPNPTSPQFPNGRLIPGRAVTVVLGEE